MLKWWQKTNGVQVSSTGRNRKTLPSIWIGCLNCIFYSNKAKVGLRAMHFKLPLMLFAASPTPPHPPTHSTLIISKHKRHTRSPGFSSLLILVGLWSCSILPALANSHSLPGFWKPTASYYWRNFRREEQRPVMKRLSTEARQGS